MSGRPTQPSRGFNWRNFIITITTTIITIIIASGGADPSWWCRRVGTATIIITTITITTAITGIESRHARELEPGSDGIRTGLQLLLDAFFLARTDIHPGSRVPNPTFAVCAATIGANFGFERTLENYDSSVDLDQKFLKVSRQT